MIILYDTDKRMCEAWSEEFKDYPEIKIKNIGFEELESDYVVTAGNSYGWMTGGIDLAIREHYGVRIQDDIQAEIIRGGGKLPIGDLIIVDTHDKTKPHLVYAPTMEIPGPAFEINIFYVFSIIMHFYYNCISGKTLACCGLGTLTGGLTPKQSARHMRLAYEYVRNNFLLTEE